MDDAGTPNLAGRNVVTTVDITHTNLGSVSGNVVLILKGDTTVGTEGDETTGNVFGGGDESSVVGNITVKLQQGAHILGNVYGGGNEGEVGGNASVIIQDDPQENSGNGGSGN